MPTELQELKNIHAELSNLKDSGIRFSALIEKWPLLYKRKPEYSEKAHQDPRAIAYGCGILADSQVIDGKFETDGRPWLDANGNPITTSAGQPVCMFPGWKAAVSLVAELPYEMVRASQSENCKVTSLIEILGRFLPPEQSYLRSQQDSVTPWLLNLADKCASGAAGKRHQSHWQFFARTNDGGLLILDIQPIAIPPMPLQLRLGDPSPQRIEVADVLGSSQIVLSDWIAEIENHGRGESASGQAEVPTNVPQPSASADAGETFPKSHRPTVPSAAASESFRFAVAFSFPGEKREYVKKVDESLRKLLEHEQIFYDQRYQHDLARPNLDTYLQNIYRQQSELVAVFLCQEYEQKQWCGLEWRSIRDLIKNRRTEDIMPFRFDQTDIPGLLSIDGSIDAEKATPEEAAVLINRRLQSNRNHRGMGPHRGQ